MIASPARSIAACAPRRLHSRLYSGYAQLAITVDAGPPLPAGAAGGGPEPLSKDWICAANFALVCRQRLTVNPKTKHSVTKKMINPLSPTQSVTMIRCFFHFAMFNAKCLEKGGLAYGAPQCLIEMTERFTDR